MKRRGRLKAGIIFDGHADIVPRMALTRGVAGVESYNFIFSAPFALHSSATSTSRSEFRVARSLIHTKFEGNCLHCSSISLKCMHFTSVIDTRSEK